METPLTPLEFARRLDDLVFQPLVIPFQVEGHSNRRLLQSSESLAVADGAAAATALFDRAIRAVASAVLFGDYDRRL